MPVTNSKPIDAILRPTFVIRLDGRTIRPSPAKTEDITGGAQCVEESLSL